MKSLRILIVDDSPEDRFTYKRFLTTQSRFSAAFIESDLGEEGLDACRRERPDCVLLDYRLPDLTGVEFLSQLRSFVELEMVPVIVLTRQGNEEIAVLAMKSGAQDYLMKDSLSTEVLTRAVENAIEKVKLIRDRQRAEHALREAHTHLEQQVEERTAELTRANRMKDEFLATLSHELRTPLNAILGWITLVRDGRLSGERRDLALESIQRNARLQAKLIEDLLDVSRIISGKFTLEFADVDLNRIVEAACEVVRPAAEAKQIRLAVLGGGQTAHAMGDAARLQQAIWNLLSNAVKFTPEGGSIEIRIETEHGHVRISVTDNGQGIDAEFLPYVFDRFRQADGSSTRAHGGLGIGLAIVRHIVELHGGWVSASSQGKGFGSTFTIGLPMSGLNASPAARNQQEQPRSYILPG